MTYMTKEEIWAAALRQSAVDLNCSPAASASGATEATTLPP